MCLCRATNKTEDPSKNLPFGLKRIKWKCHLEFNNDITNIWVTLSDT